MAARKSTAITVTSRAEGFRVPRKRIGELVDHLAEREQWHLGEIDIAVVTAEEIERINREFLGHSGPTDVISFDLSEPDDDRLSGQIVVCSDVARQESGERSIPVTRELLRYVAHGLLHLGDYDDTDVAQARRMHRRQEELLADFFAG